MPSPDNGPPGLQCLTSLTACFRSKGRCPSGTTVSLPRLSVSPEVSQAAGRQECAQNGISTWLWKPCLPRLPEESKEGRLSSRGQIRAIQILLTDLLKKLPPLCPLHRDPEGATKPQPCVQARCTMPGTQCYSSYWHDATLFNSSYWSQAGEIGDCSKAHYRK